jgi:chromosome segregation ATPase
MIAMLVGFLPAGLFQQPITSQGILRHFSIALGATALGLIFRIFVLQGGRTLGQITAEVEAGLTHYARKVSDEARAIGEELSGLRTELETQRQQVGSIVTKDLKEVAEAAFAPIARSVTKIADNLEAQSSSVASSASNLQQALNRSAEQLGQAADVKADASEAAQTAIASVAEALKQFDTQMSALRSQLAGVVTSSTDEISKMTEALQKGTALAPSLAPALETMTSNVAAVSTRLDDLRGESAKVAERISASLTDDDQLLAGLEGAQEEVINGIRQAGTRAATGITQEGELARNELQQARTQLAEHLNQERQAFSGEVSRATDRLAEILQAFAARIEEVRAGAPR